MSFFGVTLETIESIEKHPNADRLDIAKCKNLSFTFVVSKGKFQKEDKVLYFPIDSIIPNDILDKMGLNGKLAGAAKNRIKTSKIRQVVSQGLVMRPQDMGDHNFESMTPEEITAALGVTKYEPEVHEMSRCKTIPEHLIALPTNCSVYDIEGADRYRKVLDDMMETLVVVTEKLEGTNMSVGCNTEGNVFVNQRRFGIKESDDNGYWQTAKAQGVTEFAKKLSHELNADVVVYGELIGVGIQGNIYKLDHNEFRIFDIKVNGKWLNYPDMVGYVSRYYDEKYLVPQIGKFTTLRNTLNGVDIKDFSNGKSVLNPETLREGVVIKPLIESYHPLIGRTILKQRSPEYLAKSEN